MKMYIGKNIRSLIYILVCLLYNSCNRTYNRIEFVALQDITNEYLVKHDLFKLLHPPPQPPPPGDFNNQYNAVQEITVDSAKLIDSLKIKVYISDGLIPIAQIKEDDQWLFKDPGINKFNDSIYQSILKSKRFNDLSYYEFNKRKLKLVKPYYQIFNNREEVKDGDNYLIFNFSRVCFNSEYSYGLLLLESSRGTNSYYGIGQLRVFLIKKDNDKWKLIEE